MEYKIAMILPYFGKLPNYFDLWLKSAGYNSTIDWLVYTDDRREFDFPANVHVRYLTWEKMKDRFQSKFDFKIALDTPYKMCDFKPSYGEVFYEDLNAYDFWGYCDPDCIWGNIRKFVTDDILEKYDRIMIHGHWSIYRNRSDVNTWYKTLEPTMLYRQVFTTSESKTFDEGAPMRSSNNINNMLHENGIPMYWDYLFDDVWPKHNNFISKRAIDYVAANGDFKDFKQIKVGYHYANGTTLGLVLIDGKIHEYETMYVHLQKRHMNRELLQNDFNFYIFPNYFVSGIDVTPKYMGRVCRHRMINPPYLKIRYKNLKYKILRLLRK